MASIFSYFKPSPVQNQVDSGIQTQPTENKSDQVITSDVIQKDIEITFQKILDQLNASSGIDFEIDAAEAKITELQDLNKGLLEKVKTLKELGLENTPSAKTKLGEFESIIKEHEDEVYRLRSKMRKAREVDELRREYELSFAGYRFVDNDSMLEIMVKYDLCMGDSFLYAKEIPDENLAVIANFKDKIQESTKEYVLLYYRDPSDYVHRDFLKLVEKDAYFGFKKDIDAIGAYYLGYHVRDAIKSGHPIEETYFKMSDFKMIAPKDHFESPTVTVRKSDERHNLFNVDIPAFVIDQKTRCFKYNENQFEEIQKRNREILDPIAVLKVEGGYIIMDAWDEEASIPEIQNPKLN